MTCISKIENITTSLDFQNDDSLSMNYTEIILTCFPYASNSELFELTNNKNKYIRYPAFIALLQLRNSQDTILMILEKHKGDTTEYLEVENLHKKTVFESMLEMTQSEIDYYTNFKQQDFFTISQKETWLKLKASLHDNKTNAQQKYLQ